MTKDTVDALRAIGPIASALGIEINADDKFLYCNGQAIAIECNSTYATIMEFMGYVLIAEYDRRFILTEDLPSYYKKRVKEYWFSDEQLKKVGIKKDGGKDAGQDCRTPET